MLLCLHESMSEFEWWDSFWQLPTRILRDLVVS